MKIKLVISAILAFLVIVFVSQNITVVSVNFFQWSLELSLVLLVGCDDFGTAVLKGLCYFRQGVVFYVGIDRRYAERG